MICASALQASRVSIPPGSHLCFSVIICDRTREKFALQKAIPAKLPPVFTSKVIVILIMVIVLCIAEYVYCTQIKLLSCECAYEQVWPLSLAATFDDMFIAVYYCCALVVFKIAVRVIGVTFVLPSYNCYHLCKPVL